MVGQEVFQSGIIPSDTDFRIYRDFGNIPGNVDQSSQYSVEVSHESVEPFYVQLGKQQWLIYKAKMVLFCVFLKNLIQALCVSFFTGIDLAFIENGFIYHTKYDTADRILTDSIQRAGT